MAKEITVPLKLDTVEAKRNADSLTGSLGTVGNRGQGAMNLVKGAVGALGISMGAAGLLGVIRSVVSEIERINTAVADTGRRAADLMEQSANMQSSIDVRKMARVADISLDEATRRGIIAEMEYGVDPTDYYQIATAVYQSTLPGDQQEAAITEALTLFPGEAIQGATAADLTLALGEQYGVEGMAGRRKLLGQFAGGAGASRWGSGVLTRGILRAGPEMSALGLGFAEQMMWLGRASGAQPSEDLAMRAMTGLEQLARLAYRDRPEQMKEVLREAGYAENTINLSEIFTAISQFIGEEGSPGYEDRIGQMVAGLGIPAETIGAIAKFMSPAAIRAGEAVLAGVEAGTYEDIQQRAQATMSQPSQQLRTAKAAEKLAGLDPGESGSRLAAERTLRVATGLVRTDPSYDAEYLDFATGQRARFGGGEAPEEEGMRELFALNQMYPTVRAALSSLVEGGSEQDLRYNTGIAGQASTLRDNLDNAKNAANSWHWIGEQAAKVDEFQRAMREAIQFLQALGAGRMVDTPTGWGGTERRQPTETQRGIGGGAIETIAPQNVLPELREDAQSSLGGMNIGIYYGHAPQAIATNPFSRVS